MSDWSFREGVSELNKRLIATICLSAAGIAGIAYLLSLGNNATLPTPPNSLTNPAARVMTFPQGASDANFTILCTKKNDVKIRFTKTGPYVTCPPDYQGVPVKLDPKLINK